jgi:transposase
MKAVGIDVAKENHKVCILDENKKRVKIFNFQNSHLGISKFNAQLDRYDKDFTIGFESTGIYHIGILHNLKKKYPNVVLLNPKRIKAHRKSLGFETKTDIIDAYIIADYIFERNLKDNFVLEKYPFLKKICRLREKIIRQQTRLKNRIIGNLHIIFPEYCKCFNDIFCKSSLNFLKTHTNPRIIRELSEDQIRELFIIKSKKVSDNHAFKILNAAKNSFGIQFEAANFEIKLSIENLEQLQKQIKFITSEIESHFDKIKSPLADINGISKIAAAGIISETGDIDSFKNRNQYYNYTGLSPRLSQSGNYESKFNHITKCGSSYLRHYLFQTAISMKRFHPNLMDLFIKKHNIEKKSKPEAHVYCAKKVCYLIFKILKTKQQFCPNKF